jgi:hypothetical protein
MRPRWNGRGGVGLACNDQNGGFDERLRGSPRAQTGGVDPCRQIFLVEPSPIGVADRFNLTVGRRVVRPMLTMLRSLEVRHESSPQKFPQRSARPTSLNY